MGAAPILALSPDAFAAGGELPVWDRSASGVHALDRRAVRAARRSDSGPSWWHARQLACAARAYAAAGVPVVPAGQLTLAPSVEPATVAGWWPSRSRRPGRSRLGPAADVVVPVGVVFDVVSTGPALGAWVMRALDATRPARCPAVLRCPDGTWCFLVAPYIRATLPPRPGPDVAYAGRGCRMALPPSGGRVWRSPWRGRLSVLPSLAAFLDLVTSAYRGDSEREWR